ncbi:mitochondrial carnitine/acylcarnitine carrier protein-like isoform X2 [Varroa destructor]|uniref:Uncharacterized protein n=2 Tax=Varroa TaxID=62624 RepID=A0A7M7KG82_VARDE|nr:mitochondrial carnitine/acylcarnitine carrier protein-like isoform X2 [Varroa destructor]
MDGPDITKNVQSACDCNRKHRIKKNIRKAPTGLVIPTELVSSISPSEPTETAKDSLGYYCRIFLAGGFAGMCLIATGHPLDTIKVRMQAMPPPRPGELPVYSGALDCAKKTFAEGGFKAFYRGMAAPLSSVTLSNSMYFLGYSFGKRLQQVDNEPLTYSQTIRAAMTAAVFMTPVTIPTDRTKCLLQIQSQPGAQKFNGPIDCLWKLYSSGGITNLYKGGGVAVLLEIPAAAVYFSTYEAVKGEHIPERGYIARVLLAGGLAGAMSWVITLPVDFVKSRVMTSCTKTKVFHVLWDTLRHEGIRAFYKGLTLVVLRAFPANAACLLGYESACKVLRCNSH